MKSDDEREETPAVAGAAQCSAAALRKELEEIIQLAEWSVGNERLGGNIVKENFAKGELCTANQIMCWLERQQPNGQALRPGQTTKDI
jgi:hypothetical protein